MFVKNWLQFFIIYGQNNCKQIFYKGQNYLYKSLIDFPFLSSSKIWHNVTNHFLIPEMLSSSESSYDISPYPYPQLTFLKFISDLIRAF